MHVHMRLAAIAALFLLAGCAANLDSKPVATPLPPAPIPDGYKVGDEFVFDNGLIVDTQTIVAVEPTLIVTQSSTIFGTIRQPKAFTIPPQWTGGGYTSLQQLTITGDLAAVFPLQIGNVSTATVSGFFSGNKLETKGRCVVDRQENIQVKAGRFDTIVVVCGFSHDRGTVNYTYWYAPSLGHWVATTRGSATFQLVSYKRAG